MEAKDKITEKMQEAARNAESQPFPGMERVWEKVTERLDEKQEEKIIPFFNYKRIAAAAAVLILLSIGAGYLLMDNNKEVVVADNHPDKGKKDMHQSALPDAPVIDTQNRLQQKDTDAATGRYAMRSTARRGKGFSQSASNNDKGNIMTIAHVNSETASTDQFSKKIEGTLVDESGEGIAGAAVSIKGTKEGGITDVSGKYEFKTAVSNPELEVKALGYADTILAIVGNYNVGQTVLQTQSNTLNEVSIVTAYTPSVVTAKYSGAADVVSSVVIQKAPVSDIAKSLQGALPGVQVTQGSGHPGDAALNGYNNRSSSGYTYNYSLSSTYNWSNNNLQLNNNAATFKSKLQSGNGLMVTSGSGQPGSGSSIQLRGRGSLSASTAPLIVLNGAPYDGDITSINPLDVEKMEILKDASAAGLYGSRGSNGVILITTKKNVQKKKEKAVKRKWYDFTKWFSQVEPAAHAFTLPEAATAAVIPQAEQPTAEDYDSFIENAFENPFEAPLSTFSIDVDNAAYANVRRFINNGERVPKDAVRVEEMINYFHYQYPQPANDNPFSINTEYSAAPWNPNHQLLKIGLQGKIIQEENLPASNLVFLIDVSGSMSDANKLPLLKKSLELLVSKLRKEDRVAIVVYAGSAGLVLPATSGDKKQSILDALNRLQSGGSTAGGAGIELAYKIAQEQFIKGGNNRVILATDGDFNVGASSNTDMQTLIEEKRKSNIFLTCLGYGMGNYKDSKMEILADKGNGNYAYIDNLQEANRFLVKEFSGSMYAIAKDVKIQIEFNPNYVQAYRLIGYENRKLKAEDFANDKIDAGELGSGHTVTALYEVIPVGVKDTFVSGRPDVKYTHNIASTTQFANELATIKFRSKKPESDKSTETITVVNHEPINLSMASPDFKLAAAVAWFGLKLRDSKYISNKDKGAILQLAKQGVANDTDGYKAEFVRLIEAAQE